MPKEPSASKPARKPTIRRRKPAVSAVPAVTHDQIAERAYSLYVSGTDGDAFTHWVLAERELTAA